MEHTAKNFVLQLGSLITLYVSLTAVILVAFGIINISFPDAAEGYWAYDSAQSSIRYGIAMVLVFFPTYIVLTRMVNQTRRQSEGKYLGLTRWLVYLSLLVGGGILLGDLVTVILTFLNGEITTRFILKALTLLVVIGAALEYYILDVRGYWNTHESASKMFGAASVVVAIAAIVLGFYQIDAPSQVRDSRIDDQQVQNLSEIQWRIEDYYRVNAALPVSLTEVYTEVSAPVAPEGRAAYTYERMSNTTFELCATFAAESTDQSRSIASPMMEKGGIVNPYNWDHGVGETCFERTVAPL
ncbi:hypothetical protein GW943_01295 [Candidatus Parcubacteria bacterium]|uniref:DUF5671 domain-containing protein n=1 Tax=Candidatus Kaiserbacteria bacterium CG10_big_fil_rev_8_21_14_0_10_47_16 TaxID=1974608 RepID=A0A2H0UDM9_9BACT|nr:hypothetical protein [Candidatus Parcubacteria bacterium]PIR84460.1 MAG: hypothetical protein COU16_02675 [Candidatus Kaiserbacteria bacterium CG10_big_fil_rev_8_21_14_0_10_47_16]